MGPRFSVSSERLEKPGIEPTTPGLEGEQLNHYAMEAFTHCIWITVVHVHVNIFCLKFTQNAATMQTEPNQEVIKRIDKHAAEYSKTACLGVN